MDLRVHGGGGGGGGGDDDDDVAKGIPWDKYDIFGKCRGRISTGTPTVKRPRCGENWSLKPGRQLNNEERRCAHSD